MSVTYQAWRASFVKRWHSNADLCDTVDYIAGHQGRVAILVLRLFPEASRALLVHAITHDQGEAATGDIPYTAKNAHPELRGMIDVFEGRERTAQGFAFVSLTEADEKALKLCDWLDAWLWMLRHKPKLATRADWAAQFAATLDMAEALGVKDRVLRLASAAMGAA
jgi:5'-deoxynucleotidase YfbR-like HD superfamily hydrolase